MPANSANCGTQTEQTPAADAKTPQNLCVPALAYDEKSIVLAWDKADNYVDVVDYHVYMDGKSLGSADANNTTHSPAKAYIDKFYANDTTNFHVKARIHNFTVDGLAPGSTHTFTVRAVFADNSESADSNIVTQTTATLPVKAVSIVDYGVVMGDVSDSATIKANTIAIQKAIDECSAASTSAYDCKVTVPTGVFKTGALFLKSNMTLQVDGTLKGSEFAADYPREKGYKLYTYNPIRRSPSLLNVLDSVDSGSASQGPGTFENIRIVGQGILDGNGWKTTTRDDNSSTISGDGKNTLTVDEVSGTALPPKYIPTKGCTDPTANNCSVLTNNEGILASAQITACISQLVDPLDTGSGTIAGSNIYGNCRASMGTFRGVRNLYISGITVANPAFHGLMFLENENVTVNASLHKTYDANNGDGLEFGNSKNAMVMNNFFDTGDDVINFAAGIGSPATSQDPETETWIFNNYIREGHGAVALGSNTGAWIEKIKAEDNVMNTTTMGLRMKSTPPTGGGGRNILFRDNAMKSIKQNAFIITLSYTQTPGGVPTQMAIPAEFRDVIVRNVSVDGSGCKTPACTSLEVNNATGDGNSKGAPIEITGVASSQDYGNVPVYHEAFTFDTVKFNNVKPVRLYYLKNSTFTNITVTNLVTGTQDATNSAGSCGIQISPTSALFSFVAPNTNVSNACQ